MSGLDNLFSAPVPGAGSGLSACLPTTGEFLADCEGMLGGEPTAAQYQKSWPQHGRRYLLESKNGRPVDRKTAVMEIYPRFLYLFSDVICMVTRNQKAWAHSALRLVEWSQVGSHNAVNQCALPALIIVLNGPAIENESWISNDYDAVTRDFFSTIDAEIDENIDFSEMAKKANKNMRSLLLRNFSSVHVHYIPLKRFGDLGTSEIVISRFDRLSQRIREDTERVRHQRIDTWTLFDAKQMSMVFDYAFKHLASGVEEPFDLNQCRQQVSLPDSTEGRFAEFLGRCMHNSVRKNFDAIAKVMGSCIVRNSLKSGGSDLLRPSVVFDQEMKEICGRALDQFLVNSQLCAYSNEETGEKCINTKSGHAKGHQAAGGIFIKEGSFVDGFFSNQAFLECVDDSIHAILKEIDDKTNLDTEGKRQYATTKHRYYLESIPDQSFWMESFTSQWIDSYNEKYKGVSSTKLSIRASVCYACLFGHPEYTLPCGHVLCLDCVREFDESSLLEKYPGMSIHRHCVLCASTGGENLWPCVFQYRPELSGIRLLSLDGGGVRGIIQLRILQRLEEFIGLDIPLGELFDFMIGTSAGGGIVLGLGAHNFGVQECTLQFKRFFQMALESKFLTKSLFGPIARLITSSIYKTEPLEAAMKDTFGTQRLFGHYGNTPRVAVTTTVNSDSRLLANYHWGDERRYLNSDINTWYAARCAFAVPTYFEPALHDGCYCWDGGLTENNPVQLGVTEAKSVWGRDARFDAVLSIGSGYGKRSQRHLGWLRFFPEQVFKVLERLAATMDSEEAWRSFIKSNQSIQDRCYRLNVDLERSIEPELDDIKEIPRMERLAKEAPFYSQFGTRKRSHIIGEAQTNELEELAHSLKASLYFFELESVTKQDDVSIVKGWICCRLQPHKEAYQQLISNTTHFQVKNTEHKLPTLQNGKNFKIEVTFHEQESRDSDPIHINVKFRDRATPVVISGFPTTLKDLKTYWDAKQ
ncbi:uncharacterized protein F4822DRAFT_437371 [Hypoxylon trugodes]|uniref:uncharacterized protein n=1 Tax=Hypoxylon trugodes TaxID=326681 RepID=UPI002193B04F|nr:uncharacterized protein F4822DRAFT_437371 [Hypoxylon trugodes]KAI1388650.1 hypothetical protein F4822DRAFT_437371 [Hypoxylon trugodes]